MATSARGKNNRGRSSAGTSSRPSSGAKKPTTIDLDAKEVKEVKPSATSAKASAEKTSQSKSRAPSAASRTPSVATKKEAVSGTENSASESVNKKPNDPGSAPKATTAQRARAKNLPNSNFAKFIGAGVVGGLITLVGVAALQYGGLFADNRNNAVIENIKSEMVTAADLAPLQNEIAGLQAKLQELANVSVPVIDLAPINNRIAALENTPLPDANDAEKLSKLATELGSVKNELQQLKVTADSLTTRLEAIGSSSLDKGASGQLINSAIEKNIAPLKDLSAQTSARLDDLENKFSMLTARIDEEVDGRIKKFDERLKSAATGEKLAKSVAVNGLRAAIKNGEPYRAALASVETLSGPSKPIELLKPFASTGIATTKTLLNEFQQLQSSILLAATADPDAGLADRLMLSIRSLVTISSSEALSGDTPEAVISRIGTNLKSGDLVAAMAEWNKLPKQAQQISNSWAEKLDRRIKAENQVLELVKIVQAVDGKSGN